MGELLAFMALFAEFRATSWDAWRTVLARLTAATREFWAIVGRGAGKSRIVALLACYFATREWPRVSGERIYVGIFAPDRKQAGVTFRYIVGLLRSVPALADLIESATKESVALKNGITIEVISSSLAAPRGRSYCLAIVEEAAFLPRDTSANPDAELLRALRPALARVPGSLLAVVSSPYARRGVLWQAWQRYHAKAAGDVVLVKAPTLEMNPTFDHRAVEREYEEDPAAAAAEYGGEFRSDVETFVSAEAVEACIVPGRLELPPVHGVYYVAFTDPSGGSSDSFTLAIAHAEVRDGVDVVVIDAVRETRPKFSPEGVVQEYAALLRRYGVVVVDGDRYAGEWPREQFLKHGITYATADRTKSELYVDTLAWLNSNRVELLDVPRLKTQLLGLERRTTRGGRDSVDHAPGAYDDVANAVAGAVIAAVGTAPLGTGVGDTSREDYVIVRSQRELEQELERRRTNPMPGDDHRVIRWGHPPLADSTAALTAGRTLCDADPFEWETR